MNGRDAEVWDFPLCEVFNYELQSTKYKVRRGLLLLPAAVMPKRNKLQSWMANELQSTNYKVLSTKYGAGYSFYPRPRCQSERIAFHNFTWSAFLFHHFTTSLFHHFTTSLFHHFTISPFHFLPLTIPVYSILVHIAIKPDPRL